MLVRHRAARPSRGETGSTLVTVVIVMLVITLLALVSAGLVTSTAASLASTRSNAQSRAAADAGLAAVVASFQKVATCPGSSPSWADDDLVYATECTKVGSEVTFRSTGKAGPHAQTTIEAVYRMETATAPQKEPALVTRAPLDLAALKIKTIDPANPATVWVVPEAGGSGDFTCNSGGAIAGSVYLPAGTVFGSGGCTVGGDVYAEKSVTIGSGTTIRGDLVSLSGNVTVTGGNTIDGSIYAKGNVTGSGLSGKFVKSIHAGADLNLAGGTPVARDEITYGGTFTHPTYPPDSDWAVNSVRKVVVKPPSLPESPKWEGFTQEDLDDLVTSGAFTRVPWTGSCSYSWWPEHEMIAKIKGFTSPTLVDARQCARLDLHEYSGQTELRTDVIFVAPSFNLQDQKFSSADGAQHRLWFIAPETDNRDCSSVPPINLQGSVMVPGGGKSKVAGMIFTQCTVHYANGGEDWQGSIHAGTMTGNPNFWYQPLGFPGQRPPADGGDEDTPTFQLILLRMRDVA